MNYLEAALDAGLDRSWPEWHLSGSHERPELLWQSFLSDDLHGDIEDLLMEPDFFRLLLIDAYTSRNVNMGGDLRPGEWLRLFRNAGFISDGAGSPTEPTIVSRGCIHWKTKAPAWTTDLDVALWFANRHPHCSAVYEATVEPRHVLAIFDEGDEQEVVVSPFCPPLRRPRLTTDDPADFDAGAERVCARRSLRRQPSAVITL